MQRGVLVTLAGNLARPLALMTMPKYHFHVLNDVDAPDEEGQELDNLAAAHLRAIDYARDLSSAAVRQGRLDLTHRIDIEDEAGTTLLTVTFGEAIELKQ